jgi:DNA-3-methyladenine glycosylase II
MTVHLNTQADLESAVLALVKQDPRLRPVFELAGMPALRRRDPGYAGLAAIVCGQQLSTASAAAIWGRLTAAFEPFHQDTLRRVRADRLGRLGLSAAKIKTLKSLAREIAAERLDLDVLANEEADAAHNTLTALHGIGPWTADVYLLFCLGHGDAWPAGDLAVQEAVRIGLGLRTRPTVKEMAPLAEPWRPLRGAAAHLWWSYYRVLKKPGLAPRPSTASAPLRGLILRVARRLARTGQNTSFQPSDLQSQARQLSLGAPPTSCE